MAETDGPLVLTGALEVRDVDRGEWVEDQVFLDGARLEETLIERLPWRERWSGPIVLSSGAVLSPWLMGQSLERVRITVEVLSRGDAEEKGRDDG